MLPLLADQARLAKEQLPTEHYAWVNAAAGEGLTSGEASWARYRFRPHVLRDVTTVDTSLTLLGTALRTPVLVGPTAFQGRSHPGGETATWEAAQSVGSLMVWPIRADQPVQGPCWWQAYVLRDRSRTLDAALHARDAGATAIVLTGDTPYLGSARRPALGDLDQSPAASLDDIAWLATETGLPVLVKGVLRADDALACLAAGAAGVIVSNHGGRQLDRALPTAIALPEVVEAVAGAAPVLVDGGLRSGSDVLTALALGATAVLLGKPVVWALASNGAAGVAACLSAVTEDLRHVMGLAGSASLADVDRSLVVSG